MNRGRSLGLVRKKKMAASAKENKSRILTRLDKSFY